MRALLLASLVAWLAGAGGQQRHPYTLWTDGDTQVGNNHHTLSGKPLMDVSSSIREVAPCLGLRLCTPTLSGLTGTDNRWSRQQTCGNTGTNLPRLMWYILWLLCVAPDLPCKGWKAQCDCGTNEIVTILETRDQDKKSVGICLAYRLLSLRGISNSRIKWRHMQLCNG